MLIMPYVNLIKFRFSFWLFSCQQSYCNLFQCISTELRFIHAPYVIPTTLIARITEKLVERK